MQSLLPITATTTERGSLSIGGLDGVKLAAELGTPLIVLDRETIEQRASWYTSALSPERTFYAAKAFCCVAMCQLIESFGMSIDVCSGGELATALAAGFPPERIAFHGNNKSEEELEAARDAGVGRIVVDSFDEMDRLERLGVNTQILLRVTPGVEAHTHEYVQTGQEDSKFGFGLGDGIASEAVRRALRIPGCELVGLHAHIGSQIFDVDPFEVAVGRLADFSRDVRKEFGFSPRELNVGGGLGVAENDTDDPPVISDVVGQLIGVVEQEFEARALPAPAIAMEPGRSIVGPAGVTLYEVGTIKEIPGVRTYVSVDGGMSDNPRHALYDARYEAQLANRTSTAEGRSVRVAGKHCESGDILIDEVTLPADIAPGDLLCLPATGAYTYSMASNYNRVPRPRVVLVAGGVATPIIERETNEDLLRLDKNLDGSNLK
jgi:diaminopimelate decarboxylase